MARVARVDHGTVERPERTPEGFVRVPAALTRTGVLPYSDGAGKTWVEYRPPAEVFAADSLASLRAKPVTDLHPAALVTADTWRELSRGSVGEDVRADGKFVAATLTVSDAALVAKVDAGERKEVSCGYTCEVDWTPGVTPEGERYDAVQRSIRYNHAALGPEGWGRAGSDVALRMDGAAVEVRAPEGAAVQVRSDGRTPGEKQMANVLKVGKREIKLDAGEDPAAAQGAVDEMAAGALDQLQKALQNALGEVAMWKAQAEAAAKTSATPPPVTEESVPDAVLDSAIAKRDALRADARAVLGDEAFKALKPEDLAPAALRKCVLAHVSPKLKLDSFDAKAIEQLFTGVVVGAKAAAAKAGGKAERNDALANAHRAALEGEIERNDSPADPVGVMAKNREDQRQKARERAL